LEVFEGELVQKQPAHIRRTETKYFSNVTAETLHWVASHMRKRVNACITD
jgi:hypothetical protein